MHAFLAGLAVGVFAGGAVSYLIAQRVINSVKAAAKAFDQPPHH